VAFRGRHTRSHPQLPLATPEAGPLVNFIRRKAPQGETSTAELGNLQSPSIKTPFSSPHLHNRPFFEASRFLNFGSVPTKFSPPSFGLDGKTLVNSLSPVSLLLVSPVQAPSPLSSPPPNILMAGENPPMTRMEAIIATRYDPLLLPHPLNSLLVDGYLKQLPKFTGGGDITVEEHLESFYSFTDDHVIRHADVWMRIFVHSLEGEARKWFRALPPGSVNGIEALDNAFLRQWGDKKDFMYYMTEFGYLKRKEGESVSNFSKRFNKMYNKIPTEIKPSEASAKITYASSFDPDFFLLLRKRRDTTLAHIQDVAIEVESNILVVD
jgi:hypothetical protein